MKSSFDAPTLIREGQRLLREGDEEGARDKFLEAGQRLYDQHSGKMLAQCAWRWGDAGRDLVQEVFQLLWQKMPELEHPEGVEGWLYGVRDNKMLQNGRNAGRRKLILEEKRRSIAESVHRVPTESPEEIEVSREGEDEHRNITNRLPQALEHLDPDDVTLLRMRFHLGLGFSDIGIALGVSEATARRRLGSVLKRLNNDLRKHRRT